jgi:WD40 repeat protein
MSRIFINYRRLDDPGHVRALVQQLRNEFGASNIFWDYNDPIKPGDPFPDALRQAVIASDVLLAVIGPRWLEKLTERSGSAGDYVVDEIKLALDQGRRVIPVLVGDSKMPAANVMPESIRRLASLQAVELQTKSFNSDCEQKLIPPLKQELIEAEKNRKAHIEKERTAAAAERRKDQLRIQELEYDDLGASPTIAALETFIRRHEREPGPHVKLAREKLAVLRKKEAELRAAQELRAKELADWKPLVASSDPTALEEFIKKWPKGEYLGAARLRLRDLEESQATRRTTLKKWADGTAAFLARPKESLWRLRYDRSDRTLTSHSKGVLCVAPTPDGNYIVSSSSDATVKVWSLLSDSALHTLSGHAKEVTCIAVTRDSRFIISGSADKTVRVWDLSAGTLLRSFSEHKGTIHSVAVTPDGRRVISGSDDTTIIVWERASGRRLRTIPGHHKGSQAVLMPNGKHVVSRASDGTLKAWQLDGDGAPVTIGSFRQDPTISGSTGPAQIFVGVTSGGHIVFGGRGEASISIREQTSTEQRTVSAPHAVRAVAATPDNRLLLSVGDAVIGKVRTGTIKVLDFNSGRELRTLSGHLDRINALAVTPDGKHAISASADMTIKIWDINNI